MNHEATIRIASLLNKTLHTREAAVLLLQAVAAHPCNTIELDFTDIDYISRSFADQFHSDKLSLAADSQKTIIVTNANEEVVRILQALARTQNKTYANSGLPDF